MGSSLRLGRSPGGGHGNPPRCSCLENLITKAWWARVRTVAESGTQLKPLSVYVHAQIDLGALFC